MMRVTGAVHAVVFAAAPSGKRSKSKYKEFFIC